MNAPGKLSNAALSKELRKLAIEVHTITDDGTPVTREQKLADIIWKLALGCTEKYRDEEGNLKEKVYPPAAWAIQFVFERVEGKAQTVAPDETSTVRAKDKVAELARERVNRLAAIAAGPPALPKRGE